MNVFVYFCPGLSTQASPLRSLTKINKNNQIAKLTFLEELHDIQNRMEDKSYKLNSSKFKKLDSSSKLYLLTATLLY